MGFLAKAYVLTNKIQRYEWGERGPEAFLAKFLALPDVPENTPLAELWMGISSVGDIGAEVWGQPGAALRPGAALPGGDFRPACDDGVCQPVPVFVEDSFGQ